MMSKQMRRIAIPLVVVLLVITGFVHTVLPRPAELNDWRLWVWMDQKYGVEVASISRGQGRVHWWAGRITSVSAVDLRGDPLWDVTWRWPDHWVVRAHRAGVRLRDLSWAFTNMKREMFGVQIGPSTREATDGPLEFVGTKVDVFSEMVRYFGTEVSPFLLRANQPYVWLFDRELGRMVAVNRDKAAAMGYELSLARGGERSEPLIEPPAGGSPAFQQPSGGLSP